MKDHSKNPHYKVQTQQFDLEITAPVVKRKNARKIQRIQEPEVEEFPVS